MRQPPLACTVRQCGRPLVRDGARWTCAGGHHFDVARRGYVNLLQPTDRRSRIAGDSREAVEARARLRAAGIGGESFDRFVGEAGQLLQSDAGEPPVVVDLGCGSGETLAAIAHRTACVAIGIDLSVPAVDHAARRFPAPIWVVANADRGLPVLSGSVDLILSQQGRRHPVECARALKSGGSLLVSVPGPDDLVELRAAVQGERVTRSRIEAVVAEHAAAFTAGGAVVVQERRRLERPALLDLLLGTYRGERASAAAKVGALDCLDVTLSATLVRLRRR